MPNSSDSITKPVVVQTKSIAIDKRGIHDNSFLERPSVQSYEQRKNSECFVDNSSVSKQNRLIIANRNVKSGNKEDEDFSSLFCNNELVTSKYTFLNFLPKNLFEQFRRLANFYFLCMAIVQTLAPFSPIGPSTSLIPLTFVVATTAIKQAYEDYLRHKLDVEINNRLVRVLNKSSKELTTIKSKNIRVGDIVYVTNGEEIPCDMILLASSLDSRCHVTTANLDGETSLKLRNCISIKQLIGEIGKINELLLIVECEQPNATLYEFKGYLRVPHNSFTCQHVVSCVEQYLQQRRSRYWSRCRHAIRKQFIRFMKSLSQWLTFTRKDREHAADRQMTNIADTHRDEINRSASPTRATSSPAFFEAHNKIKQSIGSTNCHEIPLDTSNLLLRASRLKNTKFIYGLAIYTGPDTKVAYNSRLKPNKFSSIEHTVNRFLILCFLLLLLMSLVSTVMHTKLDSWYLKGLEDSDKFYVIFLAHFLIFNYIVPISLYVTLEFVRFVGTLSVIRDKKMRIQMSIIDSPENKSINSPSLTGTSTSTTSSSVCQHEVNVNNEKEDKERDHPSSGNMNLEYAHAECNSSDLNEELGQVEVLFSDKTGTLTENQMTFRACSSYGLLYKSKRSRLWLQIRSKFENQLREQNQVHFIEPAATTDDPAIAGTTSTDEDSLMKDFAVARSETIQRPTDRARAKSQRDRGATRKSSSKSPRKTLKSVRDLKDHKSVVDFFTCLCLCSNVSLNESKPIEECLPQKCNNIYDYRSASPDEESLVSAAHLFGITMCKSNDSDCYIYLNHEKKCIHYERLCILEFNSVRKRMSVIYRHVESGQIFIVTKGSEDMLSDCVNLLDPTNERITKQTLLHCEMFSKSGLRTLLVAKKRLDKSQFYTIQTSITEAMMCLENRQEKLDKVYKSAERDMLLIGSTAVEDNLQEGVGETIGALRDAGIKVWLLTGDKVETATSVAYSCNLLDDSMTKLFLVRQQDNENCHHLLNEYLELVERRLAETSTSKSLKSLKNQNSISSNSDRHNQQQRNKVNSKSHPDLKLALIADGRSLYYAMRMFRTQLERLCSHCTCILGCRLSPMQKADIVKMIKNSKQKPVTAAIGDGANDVSMIQEAHVGIGIMGKEGRQAVNSSDFSLPRFRFLQRLLFVHGHLFYVRVALTTHYFFYKNIVFVMPQFLFSFYNGFSATSFYHPMLLISFNVFFTSLPIIAYGLVEHDIPELVLERYPRLYKLISRNAYMKDLQFFTWIITGCLQAIIIFYSLYYTWGSHTPWLESAKMAGLDGFSTIVYFTIVLVVSMKLVLVARSRSMLFGWSIFSQMSPMCSSLVDKLTRLSVSTDSRNAS
ncbi:putative phospholipid-transporting ATPase IF, partial [Fragariocoptes setiger]